MVFRKQLNEEGDYKDVQQVRWDILEAHEAWTPEGMNVGWDEYPNIHIAAKAYHLTYDPLPEGEDNAA